MSAQGLLVGIRGEHFHSMAHVPNHHLANTSNCC